MTTPAAAAEYPIQHLARDADKVTAVYNPNNSPVESLPTIFGFNNGGRSDWLEGILVAEDGEVLGGHICSHELYMKHDLGILENTRPDRHEKFRAHYPNGYKMEFVGYDEFKTHERLKAAIELANKKAVEAETKLKMQVKGGTK